MLTLLLAASAEAVTLIPSFSDSGVGAFSPNDAQTWTGVNRTQQDAVFELNFDYQNESQSHVLFELGGSTDGSSLILDGDRLIWHSRDSGSSLDVVTPDLAIELNNSNIQIVVGISLNSNGANETVKIYANGALLASDDTQDQGNDWAGNNVSVLGDANQLAEPGIVREFAQSAYDDGSIAFSFYAVETYTETFDQVLADVVVPESSTLALIGLGGLLFLCRHRKL